MRKAKTAAIAIGSAAAILTGGAFATYKSSPVVGKAGPRESIYVYDVKDNVSAKIAALTSIRSTATTTGEAKTTVRKAATVNESPAEFEIYGVAATAAATEAVTETAEPTEAETTAPNTEAPTEEETATPTEAPTEQLTAAPTDATVPATEAPATEAETAAPAAPAEAAPQIEAPGEPVLDATEAITESFSEPMSEAYSEPVAETVTESYTQPVNTGLSDSDYIVLCNAVAHEAGCDWISTYDKAKVVEVIMNRVYSPLYPDSIVGVLTQPYQFTGSSTYVYLGTYSCYVSQSVKDAVDLYFSDPSAFSHGYYSFWGDGTQNHFS
ncbi:MAG: cell wall hydrolase [Ruminococcus sp.]|nr:cell wall hydrolase [Ruminococcus sp.]